MCSSGNIKSNQVFFDDSKDNALLMLIIGLSDFLMMAACASMTEIKAAWYQFKNFTMYHCQNNCWLEHVLYCTVLYCTSAVNGNALYLTIFSYTLLFPIYYPAIPENIHTPPTTVEMTNGYSPLFGHF